MNKWVAVLFVCMSCALTSASAGAQAPADSTRDDTRRLSIEVVGRFRRLVLEDPKRRVNRMVDTKVQSSIPGCFRTTEPEQFGVPEDVEYTRFRIQGPELGDYLLEMEATASDSTAIFVRGSWRIGTASMSSGRIAGPAGKRITCRVRLSPKQGEDPRAFTTQVLVPGARKGH